MAQQRQPKMAMNTMLAEELPEAEVSLGESYHAALICSEREVEALRSEWNGIATEGMPATLFQRFEWTWAWWKSRPAQTKLFLIAVRKAGQLVAIAPLCVVERREAIFRLRYLQFMGSAAADYCDFLIRCDREQCIASILDALFDHQRQWDVIELSHMRTDSPNFGVLQREMAKRRLEFELSDVKSCPTMVIESDTSKTLSGIAKGARYDLKKGLQRLEGHGSVRYEVLNEREAALQELPAFLHVLHQREESAGRHSTDAYRRWLLRYFTELLKSDAFPMVHFSRLCVNDRTVAYHFGFQHDGTLYWYKPTFDPAYSECSPGKLIIKFALEAVSKDGARELDFLLGDEAYKFQWTKRVHEIRDARVFGVTLRAKVARHWHLIVKPSMKKMGLHRTVHYGLSKWRGAR